MTRHLRTYTLPKTAATCCYCGAPLTEKDTVSVLQESLKDSFIRKDTCASCYPRACEEAEEVSYWWPIIKKRTLPKKKSSIDARAMELLKESMASADVQMQKEAYVLALHLLRRKRLRLVREEVKEGTNYGIYEVLSTKEIVAVELFDETHLFDKVLEESIVSKVFE